MSTVADSTLSRLMAAFRSATIASRPGFVPPLELLRQVTQAQATGLWRLDPAPGEPSLSPEAAVLTLVGFAAIDSMPLEVQHGFCRATQSVPLSAGQFGIVQAVQRQATAVNLMAGSDSAPDSSPLWVRKFGARQSLACPIWGQRGIIGAVAVATPIEHAADSELQRRVEALAVDLGPVLDQTAGFRQAVFEPRQEA